MDAIRKGIKQNQKYQNAQQYAKKIEGIARNTNWFQTKTKYDGARRLQQQQRIASQQFEFGRRQLMIKRSTRLQQLYEQQMQGWENQLKQKGLSIYKVKI